MPGSLLSRYFRSRGFHPAESNGFQVAMTGDRPAPAHLLDPAAWHYSLADDDQVAHLHGY
jgi:hypothetical protein